MPLTVQKVDVGSWSVCAPKHTAGEVDTLPFRAAIWERLAVDWQLCLGLWGVLFQIVQDLWGLVL